MDNNIADKLKAMLDDPATMNTLSSILDNMQPSGSSASEPPASENTDLPAEQGAERQEQTAAQLARMLSSMSSVNDPGINLLNSLRPYMRKSRLNKMDQAIRLIQISKMASIFSQNRQ